MSNQNTKEVELLFSEAIILTENLISFKKNFFRDGLIAKPSL